MSCFVNHGSTCGVRMKFETPLGATPIDPDEATGLIPEHIALQSQLNEWEESNILDAE